MSHKLTTLTQDTHKSRSKVGLRNTFIDFLWYKTQLYSPASLLNLISCSTQTGDVCCAGGMYGRDHSADILTRLKEVEEIGNARRRVIFVFFVR